MMPAMVDEATFPEADAFPNADIPLPEGMPPAPAAAAVVGPLPYNFKMNADGVSFDEYGYSDTAVVKDWRQPTKFIGTKVTRPSSDDLFTLPKNIISMEPDELLNPSQQLTKEEKKAKAQAAKDERARRDALGDAGREAEDAKLKHDKWLAARVLNRRELAVRIARKTYGYGVALTSIPSVIAAEHLDMINSEIAKVLPEDNITLSSDQAVAWCFHAVPLDMAALKYYNVHSRYAYLHLPSPPSPLLSSSSHRLSPPSSLVACSLVTSSPCLTSHYLS